MPRAHLTSRRRLPASFEQLVSEHMPAAIHDEVAYANTMEWIDRLTSLPQLTAGQRKYLDTLSVLAERYEEDQMGAVPEGVDGIDVLRLLMEDRGMNASDLGRLLGDRSLGPKILNRDRELSKAHIRTLADHFSVTPSAFL